MAVYMAEHNDDITGIVALSTTLFLDGFVFPGQYLYCRLRLVQSQDFILHFPKMIVSGLKMSEPEKVWQK